MLGRRDPILLQQENKQQIIEGLLEMELFEDIQTFKVASKFYRLENTQQGLIYYSSNYERKSKHSESHFVQFTKTHSTGNF